MFGSPRYRSAMHSAFEFAHELYREPSPVHFLVGISEGDGPAAEALQPGAPVSLRDAAIASFVPRIGYLHVQAQGGGQECRTPEANSSNRNTCWSHCWTKTRRMF